MKIKSLIIVMVLSVALSGCLATGSQGGGFNKQLGGTLLGGALGGWAGSNIGGGSGKLAATAGGAILGALLGNSIGQSLDRADRLSIQQTTQVALERAPIGQTTAWRNPDPQRQTYGSVTPTRTYRSNGRFCREYQQDITVGGRTERAYGKACRQPDGTWQIVNGQQSNATPVYRQPAPVYQHPAPVYQSAPVYNRRMIFSGGSRCRWVYNQGRRYCGRWR